jgi:small-conductance mechanosensitive channel
LFHYLDNTTLPLGRHQVSIAVILQAAVSVAVLLMLALWAGAVLEERLMRVEGLHSSLRVVLARMARAVLILVSLLVSLSMVGIDLTVLSVFGGALGVGLGLGLQKIASNYLSGFIILLDRSIRLGDMITADGHYGEVTRITTRYAVVRSLNGVEAIIPNDVLVTTTVLNHSYSDKRVRLALRVQVGYRTDMAMVLKLMVDLAQKHPRVLHDPEPTAQVFQLADSGVDVELGFWIEDPERGSQNVRSDLSVQLLAEFGVRGIEIPYPQREVRLVGPAPGLN